MSPEPDNESSKQPKEPFVLSIDPGTLLAIVAALILLPLLLTGFISQ